MDTRQYDNPIMCYSEDVLKEMSEKGTWQMAAESEAMMERQGAPGAAGPQHKSAVLDSVMSNDRAAGRGRRLF